MKVADPNELQVIPSILDFFELGTLQEVEPVSYGIGNHNYYVQADDLNYVVKFLRKQSILSIENDSVIHEQLEKVGIHSPKYLVGRAGENVYQKDNLLAVVSKKIEGSTPRLADEHLAFEIGKLLAQFHTHVNSLPNMSPGWLQPTMQGLQTIESDLLYRAELPKGIAHGDMHLYNILVDEAEKQSIIALFDFEEVGEDLLVLDLARSILGVCCNEAGDTLLLSLITAEIAGYESIRQLSSEEKQILPTAIKYAGDVCIKWFQDHGFERYVENHRRRVACMVYT